VGTTLVANWKTRQAALAGAALLVISGLASAQMPDMRSMSGTPLATSDLPAGSVAVRVVRESITNNIPDQTVELHVNGETRTMKTDAEGRAVFAGLAPGSTIHAHVSVGGEDLNSQEFTVPPQGGVRVMLVAGLGGGGAAPAGAPATSAAAGPPAQPGTVVLGGQSRFIIELNDAAVDVYNIFEIVNPSNVPVQTEPLVFEFPAGSRSTTLFEGATPQAKADGPRVIVTGPFPPGVTQLPMAYQLPYETGALEFSQVLPADMPEMAVLVSNSSGLRFASPQVPNVRAVTMENKPFLSGLGGAIPKGTTIQFALDGLPYHSQVGRYLSLGLVVLLLGVGAWLAVNGEDTTLTADRTRAVQKRDRLLHDLAEIERQQQASLDPRLASRREHLIAQLEKVYRQIDHLGGEIPGVPQSVPQGELTHASR